jgi:hypothetical protein
MGYFSDSLDFEKFFAKDLLKGISKDPKRLILGVDPASTWAWNKVLGRDDKPLVDQMGGPYDGRVFSYGHGNGEVYDRAQAAGINTESAQKNHDAAHIIAASYALGGGFGNMGGGGEGAAQPGLWEQGFAGKTNFATGMPTGGFSTSGISGIAGPVGGGTGASSAASMGAMDYAKLGMGLAGSAQPQQQHQVQPQQAPVRNMAQPTQVPTYGQRIGQGLGRVSSAMFPVDPSTGLTADQTRQLQTNALMQMGLGMLGSSSQGAGFGEAAAKGYGLAQGNLQGRLQQNYENSMANRAETRAVDREKRLDEQSQWMREHQSQRDTITDARQLADFDYRAEQDRKLLEQRRTEAEAIDQWRKDQLAGRTNEPPTTRQTDRGLMQWNEQTKTWNLVPGTEPTGVSGRPIPQGMANDLKTNATVIGQIDKLLPQLRTPDGKGFDPKAESAFGARNAVVDMLTPDAISDNVKNMVDSEGTDLRATVTNLNSFIVKERNGAAVTVAEFARQRGFLPTDKDRVTVVETKLKNLREALASEQQYMLDFAESQGYRPPPAQVRAPGGGLGQPQAPGNRPPLDSFRRP